MACKPDSVHRSRGSATIHLPAPLPTRSSCQPGPQGPKQSCRFRREAPIWHCSRWGLPCRSGYPSRGGLLPHRFTVTSRARRSVLCGAVLRVSPTGRYPAPLLHGVRTFLPGRVKRHTTGDHPAIRATRTYPQDASCVNGFQESVFGFREGIRRRNRSVTSAGCCFASPAISA